MKFFVSVVLALVALAAGKPLFPVFYSAPGYLPTLHSTPIGAYPQVATHTYVAQGPAAGVPQILFKSVNHAGQPQTVVQNTVGSPSQAVVQTYSAGSPAVVHAYSAGTPVGVQTYSAGAPAVVHTVASPGPAVITGLAPTQHSFHSQDGKGAYSFGYYGGSSSRAEARDNFGNVRGAFNYIDGAGEVQSAQYTAGKEGFNVAATNIPQDSASPVVDTQAVREAKEAFQIKFDEEKAKSRGKRSADPSFFYSTNTYQAPVAPAAYVKPFTYSAVSPVATPLTYSAAHSPLVYSGVNAFQTPLTYATHTFQQSPLTYFAPPVQYKAGTAKLHSI